MDRTPCNLINNMEIRALEDLTTPDGRTLRFTPLGLSTGPEILRPDYAAEFQQQVIAKCDLHPDVPEGTRNGFERLRTLHSYGILWYDAFTVAENLSWFVMEQAFRERFVTYYDGMIPFVSTKTGDEDTLTVQDFEDVYRALNHGGSHANPEWQLKVRSTDDSMKFRATFSHLLNWARAEGLLHGQRNKRTEEFYRRIRNQVAHPSKTHLAMPPDSERTIHDLAEIINRLWGHSTAGGRLYPAPLDREVLVVAWIDAQVGMTRSIMRDYQLATFNEPGNWECIVIRALFEDRGVSEFDAQYERTNLPAELLWGPTSPAEALEWLENEKPRADTATYLDRLFVLRIHEGRVSLPRRPEISLALPPDKREGSWYIIRADYPNDAFGHVRHIKNETNCGEASPTVRVLQSGIVATSPPIQACTVEELFKGSWKDMVDELAERFNIKEPATLSTVRVPPWFSPNVAPDVEDD